VRASGALGGLGSQEIKASPSVARNAARIDAGERSIEATEIVDPDHDLVECNLSVE
jgi:hypothetical protein